MNDYLQTALSGWAGVLLFGSGLAMPYLLRRSPSAKAPYPRRMWPHYWLGYLTFFVSFAHAWFAMRSGNMRGMNLSGVWIATVALIVMLWQIVVGLLLRDPAQSKRRALRRLHFWTMALVAGLIVLHVFLNDNKHVDDGRSGDHPEPLGRSSVDCVLESPGAIAGTTVKRTETRYLCPDGKTMYVQSARSGKDPMILVFTRDK